MKRIIIIISVVAFFLIPSKGISGSGEGDFSASYLYLDEEGNRSVEHAGFNLYEGPGISVENLRYNFDNGLRLSAQMKNIILNNRNLNLGMEKSGLFGVRLSHNQYRRIYNFDGSSYIRRHTNSGQIWVYPHRHLKLWGGGKYIGRSGTMTDLFDADPGAFAIDVDYEQFEYKGGFQLNYSGGLLRGEYRGVDYSDNENPDRDQTRSDIRFDGLVPVPHYEWITISGGFRHFESKYDVSDFKISSNRGWGGFRADLPENFRLRYDFVFDRTGSDSDYVATDNITNAVYVSHIWPRLAQLTVGYQHGISDDLEDEIKANSFYVSGWLKPFPALEFRGELGISEEEIKDGSRLVGDESRNRYKFSMKYTDPYYGAIGLKFENKIRENDNLGTRVDYTGFGADYSITVTKYGYLSAAYLISKGKYENLEETFEFLDHTLSGDINTNEYKNITAGFGLTYYRSQRDLDVESIILRFRAGYRILKDLSLQAEYNVHNFDDFLVRDRYYTSNTVEIRIIKHISF